MLLSWVYGDPGWEIVVSERLGEPNLAEKDPGT